MPTRKTLRTGRRKRPPIHDAMTNPPSCAVEVSPAVPTATSNSIGDRGKQERRCREHGGARGDRHEQCGWYRRSGRSDQPKWGLERHWRLRRRTRSPELFASGDDRVTNAIAESCDVVHGQALRADRLEDPDLGFGVPEAPVVLAQCVAGAVDGEWKDGNLCLDRQPERAGLERAELAGLRACALREDHDRDLRVQSLTGGFEGLGDRRGVATLERDVACQPHHPADERDAKDLDLRHPLHLGGQVRDQEDVDETLVVRHHHVRVAHVLGQGARGAELPQRRQPFVDDGELAEQVARRIRTLVEGHRDQSDDRDQRRPDDHDDPENEPTPDREDGAGERRLHCQEGNSRHALRSPPEIDSACVSLACRMTPFLPSVRGHDEIGWRRETELERRTPVGEHAAEMVAHAVAFTVLVVAGMFLRTIILNLSWAAHELESVILHRHSDRLGAAARISYMAILVGALVPDLTKLPVDGLHIGQWELLRAPEPWMYHTTPTSSRPIRSGVLSSTSSGCLITCDGGSSGPTSYTGRPDSSGGSCEPGCPTRNGARRRWTSRGRGQAGCRLRPASKSRRPGAVPPSRRSLASEARR